ncbi:MAG TPA: SIR2 family protein [Solirubrobacteraceae bacterium]|nr:SIR2 family protein [Solirubrobacteraceae bacterium]
MKLLTRSNPEWSDLSGDDVDEASRNELDGRLRQLLGAERLLVLAGLGTSLSIETPAGGNPAPAMDGLWNRAKDRVGQERWSAALVAAGWQDEFADDIELLLSRCQMSLSLNYDAKIKDFVSDCEAEIVEACRFINSDTELPVHEAFLRRIARRPTRLPRAQLYTTNYDLAFETAASRTGFAVIDGFSHTAPQRFDSAYFDVDLAVRDRERAATAIEWMPNVLQLLKLHGSVDWEQTSSGVVRTPQPKRPLIVYPRATKFEASYQQPFLEFMAKFQSALRQPDTGVLVIGSGWSDQHLAEPLLAAIRSNVRLSMLVVAPNLVDTKNEHIQKLIQFIRRGDRRLALLAATFQELVSELPELMPETEAEQHQVRTDADKNA